MTDKKKDDKPAEAFGQEPGGIAGLIIKIIPGMAAKQVIEQKVTPKLKDAVKDAKKRQ